MKLKFEEKEIELVDIWFKYLYPYLIKFSLKNDIDISWKNDTIHISNENRNEFSSMLERLLEELLENFYKVPTQRQRTKHPGYFQKINYKEQKYVLNYVSDIVGIIGYALYYLMVESEKKK
jgi:hypothetical protein